MTSELALLDERRVGPFSLRGKPGSSDLFPNDRMQNKIKTIHIEENVFLGELYILLHHTLCAEVTGHLIGVGPARAQLTVHALPVHWHLSGQILCLRIKKKDKLSPYYLTKIQNNYLDLVLTERDLSNGEVESEGEQDVLNVVFPQGARELPVKKHPGQKDPTRKLL